MNLSLEPKFEEIVKKLAEEQNLSVDDFARNALERAIEDHMDYMEAVASEKERLSGGKTYSLEEMRKKCGIDENLAH